MIRFTFQHNRDPKALHREFVRAGARPHLYSFYPRRGCWTLTMPDDREGVIVREAMDRLGIDYDEVVVANRFEQAEVE